MTRPAPQPLPVARFVGAAAVGKKRLVRALLAQQRSSDGAGGATQGDDGKSISAPIADDGTPDPGSTTSSPSSGSSLWELDTRYYTATLSLERSRIDEEGDRGSAAAVETGEEAVVLVFDPARERTFAAAARWWSSRAPSGSEDLREPAVKLCVAHGEDLDGGEGGERGRNLRREAEAWCAENAFELIEVPLSPPPSSPSLSPSASSSSEGISRLRDALAAHVWPGLVRKAPEEVEAARRAAVAEAEERRRRRKGGRAGGGGEEEGKDEEEEEKGAYAPPLMPLADDEDLVLPTGFEAACRGAAGVEGLEELFRSLSAARAAAVAASSSAALSDEERRERAAAVALRLAEALGLDDDDDEDESDSDDEEAERRRRRSEV